MTAFLPQINPQNYQPHWLHAAERNWPETNCYVDVWIEVLASLGHDPCAAGGFTVTQDFEGDQFTFFKYPAEDLDLIYGLAVTELAIYERVDLHAAEQIRRGRLPLVEVDGFYLPDTSAVSYRSEHTKTTIGINRIDSDSRRMDYFHNGGFFTLTGEDFDSIFPRLDASSNRSVLFPYVEFVKIARQPVATDIALIATERLGFHLARRPACNPFTAYRERLRCDIDKLIAGEGPSFQNYAFNTARQFGANFDLLAAHLRWLAAAGGPRADTAITAAVRISDAAKAFQFQMARALARKQNKGLDAAVERLAGDYERMMQDLCACVGIQAAPRLVPTL